MKRILLPILAVGLCFISLCPIHAKEIGDLDIDFTLDYTYASKYMWHGYDIFGGNGAHMPSIKLSTSGFYVGFWTAFPDSAGFEDLTEFDYYLGYGRTFFEEEQYAVSTSLTYTYLDYPKNDSSADTSEVALAFSMPNLLPLGPANLVPSYTMFYEFEGVDSPGNFDDGFFHTFALTYSLPIPAFLPEQESQTIDFLYDLTYGDGPFRSDSDWTYTTLGLSTTFRYKNAYFTPGIYYQWSLEDTINPEDDFYAKFSIGYAF